MDETRKWDGCDKPGKTKMIFFFFPKEECYQPENRRLCKVKVKQFVEKEREDNPRVT